jgi:hypothetical protein
VACMLLCVCSIWRTVAFESIVPVAACGRCVTLCLVFEGRLFLKVQYRLLPVTHSLHIFFFPLPLSERGMLCADHNCSSMSGLFITVQFLTLGALEADCEIV